MANQQQCIASHTPAPAPGATTTCVQFPPCLRHNCQSSCDRSTTAQRRLSRSLSLSLSLSFYDDLLHGTSCWFPPPSKRHLRCRKRGGGSGCGAPGTSSQKSFGFPSVPTFSSSLSLSLSFSFASVFSITASRESHRTTSVGNELTSSELSPTAPHTHLRSRLRVGRHDIGPSRATAVWSRLDPKRRDLQLRAHRGPVPPLVAS